MNFLSSKKDFLLISMMLTLFGMIYAEERVILIHGMGRHGTSMKHISRSITEHFEDISVCSVDYDSSSLNFFESLIYLENYIENDYITHPNVTKYHIVGHSIGGMLGLHIAKHMTPRLLGSMVCLGSPFLGSPWLIPNGFVTETIFYPCYGQLAQDIANCERIYPSIKPSDLLLIAGNYCPDGICNLSWLLFNVESCDRQSDCLVSVESATAYPCKKSVIYPVTHEGLLSDRAVLDEIVNWIAEHREKKQ
ncbi:MAG: alpha/beta hydrolase [Gammaproteobacteria bacterium]|nr:alpha/beta hydrolase [Gammaproteobacteria bacterium]